MKKISKWLITVITAVALGACGSGNDSAKTSNGNDNITPNNPAQDTCEAMIPPEQPAGVNHESLFYPTPPKDFSAVLGWVNATVGEGGSEGRVTVYNLKVWQNYNQVITLVASSITCQTCYDPNDQVWGYTLDKSLWQNPSAWNRTNEGTKFDVLGSSVIANVGEMPDRVYHFWNTYKDDKRPYALSGARYYVTADVLIEGDAMVQIGLDFYKYQTGGSNVEAAVSDWACASSSVQTLKAGAYK